MTLHGRTTGTDTAPNIGPVLDLALREGRVLAAYQPIVDLKTGTIVAEEALARIQSPHGSLIPASAFLDVAHELGLTHLLDRRILLQAFARRDELTRRGTPRTSFLNISTSLLHHPEIIAELLSAVRHSNPAESFVIQLAGPELHNPQQTQRLLAPFLNFGMRLALDDFGKDSPSYKYLASLPFAFLKIASDLVRHLDDARARSIVQDIQQVATDRGIVTLAEHIENEAIADQARALGIGWGQGKYFGKPTLAA